MFQSSYSFENLVDNCFCENYDHQNSGEFNNLIPLAEIVNGKSIYHVQN